MESPTSVEAVSRYRGVLARARALFGLRQPVHTPADVLKRERGQAKVRAIVTIVATLYVYFASDPIAFSDGVPAWLVLGSGYALFAIVLAWWIYQSKGSPTVRRFLGNFGDVAAISYGTLAAGEAGIPLFTLYLWITFGNGFRYGIPYLIVSAVLSIIGFSVVVALGPVWQAHPSLVVGVLMSLVILPLYAGHLLHLLNSALTRANEAAAAKGQFLARMSHELRTPLNGIRGSVELLRGSRGLAPDDRSLLEVIDDSVGVSLRQIDNVLDFSKLEAGKLVLEQTDFDLHALVNSTVAMVRPTATQKRLRLSVRIAPTTPFALVGDGHHLRAVLLNLLSNAVKFTERGFVCLEVSGGANSKASADVTKIRFEVIDTGIGIAPEALPHIFDSFSQEDTSTTRRYGGTGLGTTIARQLVELMGGVMGVQSVKGRGTLFWFEIPFGRQAAVAVDIPVGVSALLVSKDANVIARYKQALPEQLRTVASEDTAADVLARGLRLGNPVHVVFVDQSLALSASGDHRLANLSERAAMANVPLVWVGDVAPPDDRLREWGYAATLPRVPSTALLASILRASPYAAGGSDSKIVSIAPWVLDGRKESADQPKVLVADDNRTNLMITRRILERAGYVVDTVETGDDAAERLTTGRYRLAVLDMHMPGLDGPEVARQYRTLRPRSRLPIIVLTANVSIAAQQACAEAGADSYLSKPVSARKLLAEVKRLLDDTTVEVLSITDKRRSVPRADAESGEREDVIDVSVLAELDRIYRDPRELDALITNYENEGQEVLRRLADACNTRNHAAYCDIVHALKSNAANVGARQLMELCRKAGSAGFVEFVRDRSTLLRDLERGFVDSIAALRDVAAAAPHANSPD